MIQTDSTFLASHASLQKQPLYFLEIDEVEVAWGSFTRTTILGQALATGYGVQNYGMVGFGF
jgi:hypothetical protein